MTRSEETRVAVAVVEHDGRFLVGERPSGVALAGYAEFPGGKIAANETPEDAAVRECLEETGIAVAAVGQHPQVHQTYKHGRLHLFFVRCKVLDAQPPPRPPFRWIPRARLADERFPAANEALIAALLSGDDAKTGLADRGASR